MANVSVFLFPIYGSYYDPRIAGLITTIAAVLVAVVWEPPMLDKGVRNLFPANFGGGSVLEALRCFGL